MKKSTNQKSKKQNNKKYNTSRPKTLKNSKTTPSKQQKLKLSNFSKFALASTALLGATGVGLGIYSVVNNQLPPPQPIIANPYIEHYESMKYAGKHNDGSIGTSFNFYWNTIPKNKKVKVELTQDDIYPYPPVILESSTVTIDDNCVMSIPVQFVNKNFTQDVDTLFNLKLTYIQDDGTTVIKKYDYIYMYYYQEEQIVFSGPTNYTANVLQGRQASFSITGFQLYGNFRYDNLIPTITSKSELNFSAKTSKPQAGDSFQVDVNVENISNEITNLPFSLSFKDVVTGYEYTLTKTLTLNLSSWQETVNDNGVTKQIDSYVDMVQSDSSSNYYHGSITFSGFNVDSELTNTLSFKSIPSQTITTDEGKITLSFVPSIVSNYSKNKNDFTNFNVKLDIYAEVEESVEMVKQPVEIKLQFKDNNNPLWSGFDSDGYKFTLDICNWGNNQMYGIDRSSGSERKVWFADLVNSNICNTSGNITGEYADDGSQFTIARENFNMELHLSPKWTGHGSLTNHIIPDNFLANCTTFNSPILGMEKTVNGVGNNFLMNCKTLGKDTEYPFVIGEGFESMGDNCLAGCENINSPVSFVDCASTLKTVGAGFMYNCKAFNQLVDLGDLSPTIFAASDKTLACDVADVPMINDGVIIKGENVEGFKNKFKNNDTGPNYRNLKDWSPWLEKSAAAIDKEGKTHYFKSLTSSGLASSDPNKAIVDDAGNKIARNKFDMEVHISPNISPMISTDNLFANMTALNSNIVFEKNESGSSVFNIGNNFMYGCSNFAANITWPDSSINVGNNFMRGCELYDADVIFQTVAIGDYFMAGCKNFKSELTLAAKETDPQSGDIYLADIPNFFLAGCEKFNKPLQIELDGEPAKIGSNFMSNCFAFNSDLTFNANVFSIGDNFMWANRTFNANIVFPIGSKLQTIGRDFMTACYNFAKPLDLSNCTGLTSIGDSFMAWCDAFRELNIGQLSANIFGIKIDGQYFTLTSKTKYPEGQGITIKGTNATALMNIIKNGEFIYDGNTGYRNLMLPK